VARLDDLLANARRGYDDPQPRGDQRAAFHQSVFTHDGSWLAGLMAKDMAEPPDPAQPGAWWGRVAEDRARWLLGAMVHCHEPFPAMVLGDLELTDEPVIPLGRTMGETARVLLAMLPPRPGAAVR
jgi:hypothetical protein